MFLGIDVGGTHTDVVLLDDEGIRASAKVPTNHDSLIESVITAIETVTQGIDTGKIERLNISTTLTTNAIVEDNVEPVGVIVSSGPGLNADLLKIGSHFHVISGSIDHRGTEITPLNLTEAEEAVSQCLKEGIRSFAVVGKFSTRNPEHEKQLFNLIGDRAKFVSVGHKLSGRLNFPRRIATAYYNSAVWTEYNRFVDAVEDGLKKLDFRAQVNVLKADGGTIPLKVSRNVPAVSILSGPAASVMGIVALCDIYEDSVILDIGGTTTDMAVFAAGAPLVENEGISYNGEPTLIRALKTHSIGIGGDSAITFDNGRIKVGPERLGPPICRGGVHPTLIDAFNYKEMTDFGDIRGSKKGIREFAAWADADPEDIASKAIDYAVAHIMDSVHELVKEINEKPVYTIHELLEGRRIIPRRIYVMGGPAKAFEHILWRAFGLKIVVPDHYEVANAVGAAVSRTTLDVELFADTSKRTMIIPNLNIKEGVGADYDLEKAKKDAKKHLAAFLQNVGLQDLEEFADVVAASSFNMIDDYNFLGRNIRVKCQIKPGIVRRFQEVLKCVR